MANKQIVFTITDNGMDGMGKSDIVFASFDESAILKRHGSDVYKVYRVFGERIVDIDKAKKVALSKLDGIDKLILGL